MRDIIAEIQSNNIRKGTEARAKVVKELELKKIDDFQRIDEA